MAFGMPRLDPFAELHPGVDPYATAALTRDAASVEDPELRSYSSGFWGLVPVGPVPTGHRLELELEAELDDGSTARAPLGAITVVALEAPAAADAPGGAGPLVAICMATHNPPLDLLERQLDSIRAQTHRRWVCLISDDGSEPERFAALQRAVAGDDRFLVSRSPGRLGFYRNFERALALAPAAADYVALSDQDDRWHPDKLSALLAAIGDARLVYSDCRVVDRDGAVVSDTYWSARSHNHADMLSLLVANSVSGAATLVRRDLLDDALPFPPGQFAHYHDHWLALVARALGEIRFVDRPLYDYVQHGHAALGHAAANQMPSLRSRLRRRDPRERVRMWRLHYFVDACRLLQCVAILRLRCGDAHHALVAPGDGAARRRGRLVALPGAPGLPRGAGAGGPRPDARRRMDAVSRVQLAAAAGCDRPPPSPAPPAAGRGAAPGSGAAARPGRTRWPRRPVRWRRRSRRWTSRRRRRPGAHQPARPDDRPGALLRRLHREVQPRPPPDAGPGCACAS